MRTLHLLANRKSGKGRGEDLAALAEKVCGEIGAKLIVYELKDPADLEAKARDAVREASKSSDHIVVAAGGDGTLRSVAEQVRGSKAIFGVVPCGTFNFFARSNGIPEDHEAAIRLLVEGQAYPTRLGQLNDRTFLINASLGLYAKSIEEREIDTARFGRNRLVVIGSTLKTMLSRHRLLHVRLRNSDLNHELKTPLIFIGNNALQLRNLEMDVANCFKQNKLAVVMLKPIRGLEMLRVLFRGVTKTLEKEERLIQFCVEDLEIHSKRKHQSVALDGEMFEMTSPFKISADPEALMMIKPKPGEKT